MEPNETQQNMTLQNKNKWVFVGIRELSFVIQSSVIILLRLLCFGLWELGDIQRWSFDARQAQISENNYSGAHKSFSLGLSVRNIRQISSTVVLTGQVISIPLKFSVWNYELRKHIHVDDLSKILEFRFSKHALSVRRNGSNLWTVAWLEWFSLSKGKRCLKVDITLQPQESGKATFWCLCWTLRK